LVLKFLNALTDRIILGIRFWLKAKHRHGRGIHPPFAYEFISRVVFGKPVSGLEGIEDLRRTLLGNRDTIRVTDHGTGSVRGLDKERSIRDLVKHTTVSAKKGQLLARIARYMGRPLILELGTGTGLSCLYMGMSNPQARILTCEGSTAIASLAINNIRDLEVSNIEVYNDVFLEWLPEVLTRVKEDLLVFIDGDHRGDRLMKYCSMIMDPGFSKAVLVLDDIHWSADMNRAWRTLINKEEVKLSLELYNTGILFLGYEIQKDHFIVSFYV
jgi:predicted O-methyltransferase YrrM